MQRRMYPARSAKSPAACMQLSAASQSRLRKRESPAGHSRQWRRSRARPPWPVSSWPSCSASRSRAVARDWIRGHLAGVDGGARAHREIPLERVFQHGRAKISLPFLGSHTDEETRRGVILVSLCHDRKTRQLAWPMTSSSGSEAASPIHRRRMERRLPSRARSSSRLLWGLAHRLA